ncbi:MAG: type II toxin-antitoxin system PemK/MazF family toxin [Bacteroidales bacterium]|nr:type II toxin-antitoxin system PemK/MazF family toxin [Bacteroidales bacterium]
MTNFKSGDIVLIEVIFSEQNESKKRPALIISTDEYNKNRKDIIIAAITSNTSRILLGDTLIDDWKKSGLLSSSLITATIQTIKNDMIIKKLGSLSKTDFETVKYNLKKAIIQ